MNSMGGYTGPNGPSGSAAGINPTGRMKAPSGYNLYQQYTPQQMQLHESQFQNVGPNSRLAQLARGDEGAFQQMEAPALKQFAGLQSDIANRFSDMGLGARHGSGHALAQNTAAQDFAAQLQSDRMKYMQSALQDLMGFSDILLGQQPYGLMEQDPALGGWGSAIGTGLGALGGGAAGFFTGGPAGAMTGAYYGANIGQKALKGL